MEKVNAMSAKAFGPEYVEMLDKWIRDIANNGGSDVGFVRFAPPRSYIWRTACEQLPSPNNRRPEVLIRGLETDALLLRHIGDAPR
jgi:hypothetical protein